MLIINPVSANPGERSQSEADGNKIGFFISPTGNDSWSGKFEEANTDQTDGSFATLERARDAVRLLRKTRNIR